MKVLPPIILLAALSPLCSASAQTEPSSSEQTAVEKPAPASLNKSASDKTLKAQETDVAKDLTGQSATRDGAEKAVGASVTRSAANNPESEDKAKAKEFYESGVALFESGKLNESIEKFTQAVKLEPANAQAQYSLGNAYLKINKYKEATEAFKRAARLEPDWPEAHFRLGWMYYVLDKQNSALQELKILIILNSPLANNLWLMIKGDKPISPERRESDASGAASNNEPTKTSSPGNSVTPVPESNSTGAPANNEAALLNTYRVGVGDVLDIHLLTSTNRSTLYTVMDGGLIEFPLVGGTLSVAGLTTDEIRARLGAELKRLAFQADSLSVLVRQYASHTVTVSGLVGVPGTKTLRREAVPLYVLLAEAQPRPDAERATIRRAGTSGFRVDLGDQPSLNLLVRPGDIINLTTRPQDFYYIAGRVNYPGQKIFQSGITLFQAILAAGGMIRPSDTAAEISREDNEGRLSTKKYDLKKVKSGKVPDPRLEPGDRIVVIR